MFASPGYNRHRDGKIEPLWHFQKTLIKVILILDMLLRFRKQYCNTELFNHNQPTSCLCRLIQYFWFLFAHLSTKHHDEVIGINVLELICKATAIYKCFLKKFQGCNYLIKTVKTVILWNVIRILFLYILKCNLLRWLQASVSHDP